MNLTWYNDTYLSHFRICNSLILEENMHFGLLHSISIHTVTLTALRPGDIIAFADWPNFSYRVTKSYGLECLNTYTCFKKGYK